jgi:hypothetical protein
LASAAEIVFSNRIAFVVILPTLIHVGQVSSFRSLPQPVPRSRFAARSGNPGNRRKFRHFQLCRKTISFSTGTANLERSGIEFGK